MGRLIKAEFVWQIARTAHTLMDFHSYSMVTVDSTNIDVVILYMYLKVTIRPEFFGAAPNFEGLSQKKYEVIRDAELSRIPTLSRICPDLMSRCVAVQEVDQNAVDHCDVFAYQRCVLLSSKCTKSIFAQGSAPDPTGEVWHSPKPRSRMGKAMPLPHTSASCLVKSNSLNSIAEIETWNSRNRSKRPSASRPSASRPPQKVSQMSIID